MWYITKTDYVWFVGISAALCLFLLSLTGAAMYYLPRQVCEEEPYKGGFIEVCHVEPSIHDLNSPHP